MVGPSAPPAPVGGAPPPGVSWPAHGVLTWPAHGVSWARCSACGVLRICPRAVALLRQFEKAIVWRSCRGSTLVTQTTCTGRARLSVLCSRRVSWPQTRGRRKANDEVQSVLLRNREKKKASQRPAVSLPTSANLAPLFPRPQGQEKVEDVSQWGLETGVLLYSEPWCPVKHNGRTKEQNLYCTILVGSTSPEHTSHSKRSYLD
jgi:hypothetical protein